MYSQDSKDKALGMLRLETDRHLRELTGSLRISKSSYEYCRAKDRHAQLRADIRRIFDGAGGRRGYRYVHNELREEGAAVSEKVVRRLMAEEGCRVAYLKRRRRYSSYRGEISDAPPPNLVERDFRAAGPNELWLTDITEFKLPGGEKAYLSPDNSACEGFFGRLENEFFYHRDWSGVAVESFMELLDEYIRFHNERRKKQSLGWMSPMQYRISKGWRG